MQIGRKQAPGKRHAGWPRDFLGNRFVYAVVSQRARGLSIGVNLNPEKYCNFDCVYCEVKRGDARRESPVDTNVLTAELTQMLDLALTGKLRDLGQFQRFPPELLQLKEVALSGDGEPTLCPNFEAVVETVLSIRAQRPRFFKTVLITNTTGMFAPHVARGWQQLTMEDEIWMKLDAGTQTHLDRVGRPREILLPDIMANIMKVGCLRSIVIQSLFPLLDGEEPPLDEIDAYIQRLQELKAGGAQISMVQVYSAHRPAQNPECGHLPLNTLSLIARRVRDEARLKAEVF